jgi:hypothetical protein
MKGHNLWYNIETPKLFERKRKRLDIQLSYIHKEHKLWPFIYYLNYFITTIDTENVANGNYLGRKRLNFLLFRCKILYFCYVHNPRLEYTTVLSIDNEFIDSLRVNTSFKKSTYAIIAQRSIKIIRRFLHRILHLISNKLSLVRLW